MSECGADQGVALGVLFSVSRRCVLTGKVHGRSSGGNSVFDAPRSIQRNIVSKRRQHVPPRLAKNQIVDRECCDCLRAT